MNAAAVARKIVQDPTQLRDDLAIWMQKCRWAGLSGLEYSKDYAITIAACQDFTFEDPKHPFLLLGIMVTMLNLRESRNYFLIFSFVKPDRDPDSSPAYPNSTVFTPSMTQGQWCLRLATLDSYFVESLLRMKTTTAIFQLGNFALTYSPVSSDRSSELSVKEFKVLGGGDTTNSIVRVTVDTLGGLQRYVFKAYLRLFDHNIEAEMFSYLHAVGFSAVPKLDGILRLAWGKVYTSILVSQFVENDGDGGKPFWDHLQEYLKITQTQKYVKLALQKVGPLAQLIGQTTHEFHNALQKMEIIHLTKLAKEFINISFPKAWEQEFREKFMSAAKLWVERQPQLFPNMFPEAITNISNQFSQLMCRVQSDPLVQWLNELAIQRIHGDLHLGQFLYQSGPPPRFIVTDLEGDPQLPPEQRREARIIWFDLGGLLRALDYIAFFGTLESLKQQVPAHSWSAEDIFEMFLVRLADLPVPPTLEQYRWAAETTVVHAIEWAEFVGAQILHGYGVKERLGDELPVVFRFVRATSELNYELGYRGQNALVPLLGVLTIGRQWLELKK